MENLLNLNIVWFVLIGVLLTGYAILDGFDLGVGAVHLFNKSDEHRRITLNAIGPVWDGNEVWLVTGGGALFAAFPVVYAAVFSGFYTAFMLLLFVLIFRAVAIEFRSKRESQRWRNTWDVLFSASSILIALIMGIALGNVVQGLPVDSHQEIRINTLDLFNPYALLVGITTVALFMMHGSIYLVLKTEGEFQQILRGRVNNTVIFFVICYAATTMATLIYFPHMAQPFKDYPVLFLLGLLNMLAVANIPRELHHGKEFMAFLSSAASIAALMALFAVGLFPNFVISNVDPNYSLNIYNSASSQKTLQIMLWVAIIGMPFVLSYTISIYWVFRGKVKLDSMSY